MGKLEQQIVDGRGAERIASIMTEQKLYILYIPKHYGQPSSLPQIIGDFLKKQNQQNKQFAVIVSPGYLGDKQAFIHQMASKFKGYVSEMELYKGMSTKNKSGVELLRYNEQGFNNALSISVTPHTTKRDHRKMIFFNTLTQAIATAQVKSNTQAEAEAEKNTRQGITTQVEKNATIQTETSVASVTSVQTEAILIGSSNFSYETYFGKGKGEADVFLFYDNAFATYCRGAILDEGAYADCVLSESIAMKRTETPQSYLNQIYDEFRRHA